MLQNFKAEEVIRVIHGRRGRASVADKMNGRLQFVREQHADVLRSALVFSTLP